MKIGCMKTAAVVLLTALVSLVSQADAQWELASLGKGFKGGAGISDAAKYERPTEIRTAYLLGALFSYRQSKLFSFQMEALYTSKGYTIRDVEIRFRDSLGTDSGLADAEIILGYLEFPIVGKFMAPLPGKYRPYLLGGGFMAISVSSKSRFTEGVAAIDVGIDNAETVDLGGVIAAGIDIKLGDGWMFFETRFDTSFSPAIKNKNHKSQVLFFQLGYWW